LLLFVKICYQADDTREKLGDAVLADKVSHERVVADARRYQPFIHQILVSCKFQPEVARLDGTFVAHSMVNLCFFTKLIPFQSLPDFYLLVDCFPPNCCLCSSERLVFEWTSGIENENKSFKSEAIMFDMVMCVVAEGLGKAGCATEASIAGEFAAASRDYAAAAGIFSCLADDHLPK
jgi:hypothetical protein